MGLVLASGLMLAACSTDDGTVEEDATNAEPTESVVDTEEESEESSGAQGAMSDTLSGVRNLEDGQYVVGEDVPAGRYVITGQEPGNLMIENNENRNTSIMETLNDEDIDMGVPSATVDLTEGDEIELMGLELTTFTPVKERTRSDVLTTGTWDVGTDIEPGSYEVTTTGSKSGKIMVYEGIGELPLVDQPIDPEGELGPESVTLELEEGQQVIVSVSPELSFEANE